MPSSPHPDRFRTHPGTPAALAQLAQAELEAVSYPGATLPRGYFCSVTPP